MGIELLTEGTEPNNILNKSQFITNLKNVSGVPLNNAYNRLIHAGSAASTNVTIPSLGHYFMRWFPYENIRMNELLVRKAATAGNTELYVWFFNESYSTGLPLGQIIHLVIPLTTAAGVASNSTVWRLTGPATREVVSLDSVIFRARTSYWIGFYFTGTARSMVCESSGNSIIYIPQSSSNPLSNGDYNNITFSDTNQPSPFIYMNDTSFSSLVYNNNNNLIRLVGNMIALS